MMLKKITSLACTLLLISGCSRRETPVQIGNREQILHRNAGSEPKDLDPQTTTGGVESLIQDALFEGLVAWEPDDTDPHPGVAERWDISDDGTVYTFYLRPNARWSNGDMLTTHDFVFSYQRLFSPALGAPYAYMHYVIKNAEEYTKGDITDFSQVGVKALDDHTLQFTLKAPTPYFLRLVRDRSAYPVHPATILKFGKIDEPNTKWTHTGNLVGNGPFMLEYWQTNRKIKTVKNPYYWDAKTVRLKEIHFYPIEDVTAEERAFRTGQLHITKETPSERIQFYRQNHPDLIRLDPLLGTYFYELNTTKPPLDDVRVRQALAMALDREQIVKHICKAGEPAAYNLTPPDTAGYTSRAKIEYDPAKARKLLAEAGYPNGKGFPKMEILYNTHKAHMGIAEVIQQQWKEALNIDVELLNMEWKTYLAMKQEHKYDIARASWIGDYIDPSTFLEMYITGGGNNNAGWSNKNYDALIQAAGSEMDQVKRFELFQQAEEILMMEAPIIPIYYYHNKALVQSSVKNWMPNPLDRHPYKYVYLEADE
ncbi:MAG: peptide ABC transporter substrate-binding protein [Kiritimatiellales bacterium]|nr:peptide ABC transporter substrate-binding protein [Kiritimatiellales bacterium]